MVFFSVIIPTLNEEKFLPRLLEDLADQHYNDFEIIVVDGKSEDKTVEISKKSATLFKKKGGSLKCITSKKRNVSVQRNLGAEKAQGTYLIFFDADVQIPCDYLKKVHQEIALHKYTFLTTKLDVDSSNPQDKAIAVLINTIVEISTLVDYTFVGGFNFIAKKSIFESAGRFDETVTIGEDHELALAICKNGHELKILKEPKAILSLRRYRKEGRLTLIRKYTHSTLYTIFKGPITSKIFDYEMGGHMYHDMRKSNLALFTESLSISQVRAKIQSFLRELNL